MKKLILIDGSGLIYRGFYAIPPFMRSPAGIQTNAVFGFTSIVLTLIASQKPDFLAVAYDKKGPTFRHHEYKEYKATRVKAPDELYAQIPLVKKVTETFCLPSFEADGFEADDILATIVKKFSGEKDLEILIASGDFDLFQLVNSNTAILHPTKGFKEAEILRAPDIEIKYNMRPDQIPDYKGLAGDSSDNIPGVYGIGDKGATTLLKKYDTLENIYEHLGEITGAIHDKLDKGRQTAYMSKKLATLHSDVPLNFDLDLCRVKHFDVEAAQKLFAELGFKSLQRRLEDLYGIKNVPRTPTPPEPKVEQGSLF